MHNRLRRLRTTPSLRRLVRDVHIRPENLIYPIFVTEGNDLEPISSMPGQFRYPLAKLPTFVKSITESGIGGVLLFGLPTTKDENASQAYAPNGVVQRAIQEIKSATPETVVITDVCLCAYTNHGHCGVIEGQSLNQEKTLPLLAKVALSHAQAGADIVAPSSMMDGQVGAIRQALDAEGFVETAVMAYSAKFSSGFYGPFREAADSAPSFGDRASYQHDYAQSRHAARELEADIDEGADILMVKPALAYLDIIQTARNISDLPIAAYSVSGEYSMIKAAAEKGWLDEKKIVMETLTSIKRAGADLIITYYAPEVTKWLQEGTVS